MLSDLLFLYSPQSLDSGSTGRFLDYKHDIVASNNNNIENDIGLHLRNVNSRMNITPPDASQGAHRNMAHGPGMNGESYSSGSLLFTCLTCSRSFSTKIGLGVHTRRAHPVMSNEAIVTQRVKARWSEEEVTLMAAEEVSLIRARVSNINERLLAQIPGRSLEAVKGKRRQEMYKGLVQRLLLADGESSSSGSELNQLVAPTFPVSNEEASPNHLVTTPFTANTDEAPPIAPQPEIVDHEATVTPNRPRESETPRISDFMRDLLRSDFSHSRRAFYHRLRPIAMNALDGGNVDEAIENLLKSSFKVARRPKGPTQGLSRTPYTGSRRNQRRERYTRLQRTFERCRRDAARMVLLETDLQSITLPDKASMFGYWSQALSDSAELVPPVGHNTFPPGCSDLTRLWAPISEEEVQRNKIRMGSACGPDGISAKSWSRVAVKSRALLYNILLLIGHLPSWLKSSRTVFLSKKENGSCRPGDFRPITISSVITREFHRIIAHRFTLLMCHNVEQSAYQHYDGVGKSVAVLSTIIDESWRNRKELHIACLDASKAFNSVSYGAIHRTLEAIGCPQEFLSYVRDIYSDVRTTLQFEGTNRETRVGKGVLQGDPLSGPIFMAVFECAIQSLNPHIGFRTSEQCKVSAIAYADDIVLAASTWRGLQKNLNLFEEGLRPIGLSLNNEKSLTLSLVPSGKEKKVKVETSRPFTVSGGSIAPQGIDDVWKYLGLNFEGKQVESFTGKLPVGLERISNAPLKPQQRLTLLIEHVIPGLLHRLVLGKSTASSLKAADITIRLQVRKWLHLPHDVPLGFFYTPKVQGGLGLPCLQHIVPLHRWNRCVRLRDSMSGLPDILSGRHVQSTLHSSSQALAFLGSEPSRAGLDSYWRGRLLESVDGKELENIGHHSSDSKWCGAACGKIRGEDYVHYMAIRINAIPSRDRTSRGRKGNVGVATLCRNGCQLPETTYHAIQACPRSKGMRMERHNRVVDLLESGLKLAGCNVTKEKRLQVGTDGGLQPDLIACVGETAYVVDAQVVCGQNVEFAHQAKMAKYRGFPGFDSYVKRRHGVQRVIHCPATITYRGAWSKQSVRSLDRLGIPQKIFHYIVTSVLTGSWLCWRLFNRPWAVVSSDQTRSGH